MSNRNKKRNNKKKNAKGQNENDEDASERKHWFDVMRAFLSYQDFLECDVSSFMLDLEFAYAYVLNIGITYFVHVKDTSYLYSYTLLCS